MIRITTIFFFFFFNDTATTEIYTLSLHDALPISGTTIHARRRSQCQALLSVSAGRRRLFGRVQTPRAVRSEEHTSELQSPCNLVCRLLLEKKKNVQTRSALLVVPVQSARIAAILP